MPGLWMRLSSWEDDRMRMTTCVVMRVIIWLSNLTHNFVRQLPIFVDWTYVRKVLEVEDQLLCSDVQAQVEIVYKLKNSFEHFQQKLW